MGKLPPLPGALQLVGFNKPLEAIDMKTVPGRPESTTPSLPPVEDP